jgi:preprotein translocase subunit SecF
VLSLVIFGGEVLRSFSLALLVGLTLGTYSTIAIASPIAIWWQSKLGNAKNREPQTRTAAAGEKMASASRRSVTRRPVTR